MHIHNKNQFTVVVVAAFVVLFLSSVIAGYISVSKKEVAQAVHGSEQNDARDAYIEARDIYSNAVEELEAYNNAVPAFDPEVDPPPYTDAEIEELRRARDAAEVTFENSIDDVNLSWGTLPSGSITEGSSFTLTGSNLGRISTVSVAEGDGNVERIGGTRSYRVLNGDSCRRRFKVTYWRTVIVDKTLPASRRGEMIEDEKTGTRYFYLTVKQPKYEARTGTPDARGSWRDTGSSILSCADSYGPGTFNDRFSGWLETRESDLNCSSLSPTDPYYIPTIKNAGWCTDAPVVDDEDIFNTDRVEDVFTSGGADIKVGSVGETIQLDSSATRFFARGNIKVSLGGVVQTLTPSQNSTLSFTIHEDTPLCSDEIVIQNLIDGDAIPEDRTVRTGFLVVPKVESAGAVSSIYISSFTPDSGSSGTVVELTGAFGTSRDFVRVLFGGDDQPVSNGTPVEFFEMDKPWSQYSIYPLVPRLAETGRIKVVACDVDYTAVSASDFAVTEEPAIFYFDPLWGQSGSAVEQFSVYGENFDATLEVKINEVGANYSVVSDQEILVSIPPSATTGKITVCKAGDCIDSQTDFYIQSVPPYQLALGLPEISDVTPRYYESGNRLVINGRNLSSTLWFGTVSAVGTVSGGGERVTVFVPAGANGPMRICNNNGCTSDHFFHEYTEYDEETVTDASLFVSEASGGSLIRDESIEAVSGTDPSTTCDENNPAPQILSVSTSSEYVGHTDSGERNNEAAFTITGCHFGPSQYSGYVLFNNTKQLDVISWGKNSIRTAVPFDATSGHLSVVAWTGQHGYAARASSSFHVKPVIQKLGLNRGAQGQIIDILGSDFCPPSGSCQAGTVLFGIYPGVEDEGREADIYAWNDKRIRVAIKSDGETEKDWGGVVKVIRSDGIESRPIGELVSGDGREQLMTLKDQESYFYRLPRIFSLSPQTVVLDRAKLVGVNGDGFWGDKNIPEAFIANEGETPTIDIYRTRLTEERVNQGTTDEDDRQYQTYSSMSVPTTTRHGRQSVVFSNWDGAFAQARPSTNNDRLDLRAVADADMDITGSSALLTITGGLTPGFHLYGNTLLSNIVVASVDVKPTKFNVLPQDENDRERNIQSIQLVFPKEDADANRFRNVHVGVVQYGEGEKTGMAWIRQEQREDENGERVSLFDDILEYNDIPGYERCNADGEECELLYPGVGGNNENDRLVGYGYMSPNPLIVKLPPPVISSLSKTQFQSFKGRTSFQQRDSHHVEPVTIRGKNFRSGARVFVDNKNVPVTVTPTVLYIKIPIGELSPGRHTIKVRNTDGEESNNKFIQVQ